jgi:type VI protein secretion system component Hcp
VLEGAHSSGGGGGTGKADFGDLLVSGPPSSSASDLLLATARGDHFPSAKLELSAPGSAVASATLELGDTVVTDLGLFGSAGAREETVGMAVVDPANLAANPPKLTWTPGAAALPVDGGKIGEMTITGLAGVGPIDLVSDTVSIHQEGATGVGSGGGSGKPFFDAFNVAKALDASSPELLKAMKSEKHFQKAEIRLLQPGTAVLSRRYVLTDLVVSGYDLSVRTGATEHLSLGYKRIEQFIPGPGGTEAKACWDLAEVKAC